MRNRGRVAVVAGIAAVMLALGVNVASASGPIQLGNVDACLTGDTANCLANAGGPSVISITSATGTNTWAAVASASGWPVNSTYTLEYKVYVDNVLKVDYSRACNGRETCLSPNFSGMCGSLATFHVVDGDATASNSKYFVNDQSSTTCN